MTIQDQNRVKCFWSNWIIDILHLVSHFVPPHCWSSTMCSCVSGRDRKLRRDRDSVRGARGSCLLRQKGNRTSAHGTQLISMKGHKPEERHRGLPAVIKSFQYFFALFHIRIRPCPSTVFIAFFGFPNLYQDSFLRCHILSF
jgi:hypothetical protein